jgi:pimeloyl-ACP methyl ester carboxylesterase
VPVYSSHRLDTADPAIVRAVVIVHGDARNAEDYYEYAHAAVPAGVLVVAPGFVTEDDDPGRDMLFWTDGGWKEGGDSIRGGVSSFAVVDELRRSLLATFPNLTSIVVAGHSAGGQFVQRYAATNTDDRVTFVVANPSSYLYFGPERPARSGFAVPERCARYNDYKYGLDRLETVPYMAAIGADAISGRYAASRVTYLLGSDDTERDESLDTTCEADAQGAVRLQRGQRFYEHLRLAFGNGIYARHSLVVVEGVGHSARDMFTSGPGRAALGE